MRFIKTRHLFPVAVTFVACTAMVQAPDAELNNLGPEPINAQAIQERTSRKVTFEGIVSPSGILAITIPGGDGLPPKTIFLKEGCWIGEAVEGSPLSWSPVEDIVLMDEGGVDCSSRVFLLDIGGGEHCKKGEPDRWLFGPDRSSIHRWSRDGKKITLANDDEGKTYNVDDYVRRYKTHTVSKGETLYSLAKRYNVSVEELKKMNQLPDERITEGQILKILTDRK